jgi:hypothetical protein
VTAEVRQGSRGMSRPMPAGERPYVITSALWSRCEAHVRGTMERPERAAWTRRLARLLLGEGSAADVVALAALCLALGDEATARACVAALHPGDLDALAATRLLERSFHDGRCA